MNEAKKTYIKIGKQNALFIIPSESKYKVKTYSLYHTYNWLICEHYYYINQARKIGQQICEAIGPSLLDIDIEIVKRLFPSELIMYIQHYRLNSTKEVLTYEEWVNDYKQRFSKSVHEEIQQQYDPDLFSGNRSLGWICTSKNS